jgi:hypothetical protein
MNFEQTVCEAISKSIGRKNAAAIVSMAFVYMMKAEPWQVLALVTALGLWAVGLQFVLDMYEVAKTGKDQPDGSIDKVSLSEVLGPQTVSASAPESVGEAQQG